MDILSYLYTQTSYSFTPLVVSFLIAAAAAGPIYLLLLKLKSRQTISEYLEGHLKKQGTPTMGGLIVGAGALPTYFIYVNIDAHKGLPLPTHFAYYPWLFLGFGTIGFIDDFVVPRVVGKRGLGWKQKLLLEIVVATACAWYWVPQQFVVIAISVFLVLFFSNAYNFSDGLDSLAGLLLLGLGGGLLGLDSALCWVLLPLLGSILPFLYFNRRPARVFMGDVGSLPIGAALGAAASVVAMPALMQAPISTIRVNGLGTSGYESIGFALPTFAPWPVLLALFVVSGMMIVELVPVPLQILSVKLRGKRLFSFTPIHHAFEKNGWPEQKVVAVFFACQVALSLIGVAIVRLMVRS